MDELVSAVRPVAVVQRPRVRRTPLSAAARRGKFCLRCSAPLPQVAAAHRLYCNLRCGKAYNTKGAVR